MNGAGETLAGDLEGIRGPRGAAHEVKDGGAPGVMDGAKARAGAGATGRGGGRATGQGGGSTEGAEDTGVWVLADGVGMEKGHAGATEVGSARPQCDGDVRARGAGSMAGQGRKCEGQTALESRGWGPRTRDARAVRGVVWAAWTQEGQGWHERHEGRDRRG